MLSQRWPCNAPYIWVAWKFVRLPDYAYGYFSQIVLMHWSTLWMCIENLKCVALAVPEIIGIGVLVWVVNHNLWEEEVVGGRGWYHSKERWWLYTGLNLSSILTRFRDITAFVLQHATFSNPTSNLPKFLHVPLGVGGWPFGLRRAICWANCSGN